MIEKIYKRQTKLGSVSIFKGELKYNSHLFQIQINFELYFHQKKSFYFNIDLNYFLLQKYVLSIEFKSYISHFRLEAKP